MKHHRVVLLFSLFGALPACSGGGEPGAALQSADGKIRLIHVADAGWKQDVAATAMGAALDRHQEVALVYAHDDDMAFGAATACKQKGRTGIKIIGIGGTADNGQQRVTDGLLDATLLHPTGAAVAIDMTLLACSGIVPPRRLLLGTRIYSKATVAAGGTLVPSPGDVMIEALRRQHAQVLTTTPKTDFVFRIGMAHGTDDDPWREQIGAELKAAAKRYPQLQFDYRAGSDPEQQRKLVREFIAQDYNAIVVMPEEPLALAPLCKEAMAKRMHVVVIDRELGSEDFTCFVGSDNKAIGRAAASMVGKLLPNGGAIVELQGAMTTTTAQERHQGFVEALGLGKKP